MKIENSKILQNNPHVVQYHLLVEKTFLLYIYYALVFLTVGLFFLPFHWYKKLQMIFYTIVNDYDKCTHIVFRDEAKQYTYVQCKDKKVLTGPYAQKQQLKFFEFNHQIYTLDRELNKFINMENQFYQEMIKDHQIEQKSPLTEETQKELINFYGPNQIKLKKMHFFFVLLENLFTPLNTYEMVLAAIDFYYDNYGYMAVILLYVVIQTMFDIYSYYNKVNQINKICKLDTEVDVLRNINGIDIQVRISNKQIVLGDFLIVKTKQKIPCDIVIVQGSCLIDQAVLTGESMPVNKQKPEENKQIDENNIVFAGSTCVVTRGERVVGVVVRTAWNTYQGKLVSRLVSAKQKVFKLIQDMTIYIISFIFFFFILAVIQVYIDTQKDQFVFKKTIMKFIEILTSAVPPSLFFILSISSTFVNNRLEKNKIYSLISSKIQETGRVKKICFDKTGTLTENDIRIFGYTLMENNQLEEPLKNFQDFSIFENYQSFIQILSCCHSLNLIDDQVYGDPIEEQMFKSTKFQLTDKMLYQSATFVQDQGLTVVPSNYYKKIFRLSSNYYIKILKTIQFTSKRKRMSTIILNSNHYSSKYKILTKGAPEVMKDLFDEKTIPHNYKQKIREYSEQGLRLLAMGCKEIDDMQKPDEDLESDLKFIGFILLENPLKKVSKDVIKKLKDNGISCSMITGDNLFTAISVGIQTDLIKQNQNLWVGEFQKEQNHIKWSFYNNLKIHQTQQILPNFSMSSQHSMSDSQILKSKISRGQTQYGYKQFQKILHDIEKQDVVLALDGDSFEHLIGYFSTSPNIKDIILNKTAIYGRTVPEQKKLIIKNLKELYYREYYCVGFVGDGANDAQALNEANFGLSIGNNESSLAASISTTRNTIEPCIQILEEGKLMLDNLVSVFKLACYMGYMQAVVILILASYELNYPIVYFSMDFFFWIPQFVFMSLTKPRKLNSMYPKAGMLNFEVFSSILIPILIATIFLFYLQYLLFGRLVQKDQKEISYDSTLSLNYVETCYFFLLCGFNQIWMGLAYNKGYPFKISTHRNYKYIFYVFCINLLLLSILFNNIFENSYYGQFMVSVALVPIFTEDFLYKFVAIVCAFTLISTMTEKLIGWYFILSSQKFKQQKQIQQEFEKDSQSLYRKDSIVINNQYQKQNLQNQKLNFKNKNNYSIQRQLVFQVFDIYHSCIIFVLISIVFLPTNIYSSFINIVCYQIFLMTRRSYPLFQKSFCNLIRISLLPGSKHSNIFISSLEIFQSTIKIIVRYLIFVHLIGSMLFAQLIYTFIPLQFWQIILPSVSIKISKCLQRHLFVQVFVRRHLGLTQWLCIQVCQQILISCYQLIYIIQIKSILQYI